MSAAVRDLRFFHLTGARPRADLAPPEQLRPALFAGFRDLAALRYDFPLVLVDDGGDFARTLTSVVDELLREIAPRGMTGERLRRSVLRLEREIRVLLSEGAFGSLTSLWARAADRLAPRGGAPLASDLARARAALRVDGEIVDCDARLPERVVSHAWRAIERRRAAEMRRQLDGLISALSDLLRADHLRSRGGRTAASLRSAIGSRHHDLFDFEVMASVLAKPSGSSNLSATRRERIEGTLTTLRSQAFFGTAPSSPPSDDAYEFTFTSVEAALAAFRGRLPALARLVRAIAIAELEIQGDYAAELHDEYFARFDESALRPEDVACLPTYLVRLDAARRDARTELLEGLSSTAPLKVLVVSDDLLEISSSELATAFETRVATSAVGLGDVFVLQAPGSHLYRVRDRLARALSAPGPSLISVFSGAIRGSSVPPYLVAAAALESRAFPIFAYDPSATPRFSLEGNPQPGREWAEHDLVYAGADLQRVAKRVPFTFADFAAADRRLASHFARAPRDGAIDELVEAGTWLGGTRDWRESLPFVYGTDPEQRLHRLVVDDQLVRAARRSAEAWLRLRGSVRAADPAAADATQPAGDAAGPAAAQAVTPAAPNAETLTKPAQPTTSSDEAYIETSRCTSCNECVQLNGAMFAYDENKQAYIKDLSAGPFRTLVEAAEGCQVAIIHPGRPRDPNEPGLDELVRRAEPFA